MTELKELVQSKLDHLEKIRRLGINPYPYKFEPTHYSDQLAKEFGKIMPGKETNVFAKISGRIKVIRSFGRLVFFDVEDAHGKIQASLKEGYSGKKSFELAALLDAGDIIGIDGQIVKTKKGELTVQAKNITLLCKSILPLPSKWHGLQDVETRYRQRYLDLIMNSQVKKVFETRTKIINAVREFLNSKGFMEVEIPILQPVYGGANAKPFKSHSNALKQELYMSISPELYLKRLIVGGYEKVYYLGKNFRNEDIDKTHNPEFTMMECYAANWDYNDMMKLTEDLYRFIAQKIANSMQIKYQGTKISLKTPWKRITVKQALKTHAKIDVDKTSDKELESLAKKHCPQYDGPKIRGLLVAELFEALAEEKLGKQPIFITDYPAETTPLCKQHRKDPSLIERFEPMINGWEMGNAYSELNDPIMQRKLLQQQAKEGRAGGTEEPIDEDFLTAIEYGMPPTSGLGLGIDRMVMLFTDQPTIKDVMFWPQMKKQ